MSDISTQGSETQDTGTSTQEGSQPVEGQGTETQQQETQQSKNPFLDSVDEEDRPHVAKYIDKWDAQVQRRFMEQAGQYAPYKELGEVEDLKKAADLFKIFQESPEDLYTWLHEQYGQGRTQTRPGAFQQQPGTQQFGQPQFGDLPEELTPVVQALQSHYDQRLEEVTRQNQQLQRQLGTIASQWNQQQQTQTQQQREAEERQQIEQYLGLLEKEFGQYDRDFVLTKMAAGMSGEDAVRSYQQAIQQAVNQNSRPGPSIRPIGGGGVAPTTQKADVTQLSKNEANNLVVDVLNKMKS